MLLYRRWYLTNVLTLIQGSRCRHQYCWDCLASWDDIRRHGNDAHVSTCPWHSQNLHVHPADARIPLEERAARIVEQERVLEEQRAGMAERRVRVGGRRRARMRARMEERRVRIEEEAAAEGEEVAEEEEQEGKEDVMKEPGINEEQILYQ